MKADSTNIGLDIGSSAVRAAEIASERDGRRVLRRYGQVGLPHGAVVDGEIVNTHLVADALRRLWRETGFSSNKVILGVSGHRVIVRQADVPALDDEDLRSALRFDAQELIPIPMEQASFDFTILDRGVTAEDGKSSMRILLVAAHRDLLRSYLSALNMADLEATAIDAVPLALMRVVPVPTPVSGEAGIEAVVAIGAEMTTVAVRQQGVPRFIRSLAVGGAKLTAGIANALHVEPSVAERMKRVEGGNGNTYLVQARKALMPELRDLAEEISATVDFFAAQSDGALIDRILITGGASQTTGLLDALAGSRPTEIQLIDPFTGCDLHEAGLSEDDLHRARATAATAVGLALWSKQPPQSRLTILPDEIAAARHARRVVTLAATGVVALAGLLGFVAVGEALSVRSARDQVHTTQRQQATLQAQVTSLQSKTAVHVEDQTRQQLVVTALTGDIDWVRLLGQLAAVMPPNLSLSSFSGGRSSGSSSSSSSSAATPGVGTLSFSVTGHGDLPEAAAWLEGLHRDHSLSGTWISGITVSQAGGVVTFTSTANLTTVAQSNRAEAVKR